MTHETRLKVYKFIDEVSGHNFSEIFLEYLVFEKRDESIEINNLLFLKYLYIYESSGDKKLECLKKLKELLRRESRYFDLQFVNDRIPKNNNDLYAERALILSKLGHHREALEVIFAVHRNSLFFEELENYCESNFANDPRVFSYLASIYINNSVSSNYLIKFLNRYGSFFGTKDLKFPLVHLNHSTEIRNITKFITNSFKNSGLICNLLDIQMNVLNCKLKLDKSHLQNLQKSRIVVNEGVNFR